MLGRVRTGYVLRDVCADGIQSTDSLSVIQVELNPGGFFAGYCYQYTYGYVRLIREHHRATLPPIEIMTTDPLQVRQPSEQ